MNILSKDFDFENNLMVHVVYNTLKCCVMRISRQKKTFDHSYTLNNENLQQVEKVNI